MLLNCRTKSQKGAPPFLLGWSWDSGWALNWALRPDETRGETRNTEGWQEMFKEEI